MRRYFALALVGASALLSGNASAAGEFTLGDLQKICTASDPGSKDACTFYIFGVTEGAGAGVRPPGVKAWPCVPPGVSPEALEFVVKSAMGQDLMFFPKDSELAAAGFVIAALGQQYPCH